MAMRRWSCINCGATERLTFYPDCCSSCGSAMVDDEGRSTLAVEPEVPSELYHAAHDGDRAAIVELWHAGALDSSVGALRGLLDDMLLENRIDMMMQVFSAPGREAA
ncbi:unknown [Sinorhizobium phage PBC5]|uniref:hypothetical protein n=1 Tax=Sinorhizobium phage PBC5 TaxID=179237 RepID=UPI000009B309|nr:hypothetical protein PBC5_gp42 [Sinorhizobium phage PBC5]AAL49616.1 unknown [Sinorhizobium phage PBC5]